MHALKRFGTAFGGYKMMENYPVPVCGPDDIIIEIKAAAICGADMKHWQVDNGYDDTNITPDQQQSVTHIYDYKDVQQAFSDAIDPVKKADMIKGVVKVAE